jgi:hypothetical protein
VAYPNDFSGLDSRLASVEKHLLDAMELGFDDRLHQARLSINDARAHLMRFLEPDWFEGITVDDEEAPCVPCDCPMCDPDFNPSPAPDVGPASLVAGCTCPFCSAIRYEVFFQ